MVSHGVICYPQGLAIPAGLLDSAADVSYLHIKKNLNKTHQKNPIHGSTSLEGGWVGLTTYYIGVLIFSLHDIY